MALTKEQKAKVMIVANIYDTMILDGIVKAYTDSGIMTDMMTADDLDKAAQFGINLDEFDIFDEEWDWTPAHDELANIDNDVEMVCEHLATLI
jgi:tellurite resistance protein